MAVDRLILLLMLIGLWSCSQQDNVSPIAKSVLSPDSVEIHYTTHSQGSTALLFVHGWSCDQSYWSDQIDHFAEDYQVVTLDLGGHGLSSYGSRKNWTMSAFAGDVLMVANQLNYKKLVLVGHSMGTAPIIEAAIQLKKNVAVVSVDFIKAPFRIVPKELVRLQLEPFYTDFVNNTKALVQTMFDNNVDEALKERVIVDMSSASADEALDMIIEMSSNDLESHIDTLVDIGIPRYLINADYTPTHVPIFQDEYGFEVTIIDSTGHFLMMEAPKEFNYAMDKILAQI